MVGELGMKRNMLRTLFIVPLFLILFSTCKNPLTVNKTEPEETNYDGIHRREKIDGTFDETEDEVEHKRGKVGSMTTAEPKKAALFPEYTGFEPQYVQQMVIKKEQKVKRKDIYDDIELEENSSNDSESSSEDEEITLRTTVLIEYYRVNCNLTFMDGQTKIQTIKGKYGQRIPEIEDPVNDDETFEGWEPEVPETFTRDMTFTAVWRSADADYLVLHKKQNVSGNDYTTADEETKRAPANRLTAAVAKNYPGFTAQPITQIPIAENGSTVVTVYYNRNNYTYSFNTSGGNTIEAVQGRYGAAVPTIQVPEKQGYTFRRWDPELPQTFNDNIEYTALWDPATNTQYKVEYYLQNTNLNGYTKQDENTFTGTTNTTPNITPPTLDGFSVKDFNPEVIKPDGSTVIKIYYDRIYYTVKLKSAGEVYRTVSGRYGTSFPAVSNPTRLGYQFAGWEPELPETYTTTTEYVAQWTPNTNTPYKVDCYLKNLDTDGYTKRSIYTQSLTGTTGELTEAVPLEIQGYVARMDFEQLPIAGDGSTVIAIYYDIAN